MPYNIEDTIEPFYAEFPKVASGRDPLAIQNSSVVIYTKMMVGITNVTNRIRYTGLYCWLIELIGTNIEKSNSEIEQIRYFRRAELLIAFLMVKEFPSITGISGTLFAAKKISDAINLRNGADWDAKKEGHESFWKFSGGVFGQYYSGIVRELNLINHPQGEVKIYTLTEKGKMLADDFANNISLEGKRIFWESVNKGTILESDLSKIREFALHKIPFDTDEHYLYEKILLSADDKKLIPRFHRKETLKLILKFLNTEKDGVENLPFQFLRNNYNTCKSILKLEDNTATAWYLFEINEILHVSLEHFHSCFLYNLQEHPTSVNFNINELVQFTEEAFVAYGINPNLTLMPSLIERVENDNKDVYEYYSLMEDNFKQNEVGECLMNAIFTILKVYNNCRNQIQQLNEIATLPNNNFNRRGYAIELFDNLIVGKLNLNISDYIKSLLNWTINVHTFSSYSKSKVGQSLVHNYVIEEESVWRLRNTLPNRTTPRLQNALQFIQDIGWVSKTDKITTITKKGVAILSQG